MTKTKKKITLFDHLRIYIFRGLLAAIPLFLSYLVVSFMYVMIDQKVMNLFEGLIGHRIPGLGILLVLIILYLLGLLASNVVGNRFLSIIENITSKIPILKSIYQIGKQVSVAFSLPEKQIFQKVLLTDCFRKGDWLIGFVTGHIYDPNTNEKLYKLYVPTAPTPTNGYLIFVRESQTMDPGWTVDQAMTTILSGGIVGPETFGKQASGASEAAE